MTHLDGTGDGNLVVNTTAFPTRSPANPGFVHLNMVLGLSTDPVLVGPHHARAELVENLKGRLVARNGAVRKRAASQLQRLAHKTGIAVVNTFMGKCAVPRSDPHCLFTLGLQGRDHVNAAIDKADVIISVGYDSGRVQPLALEQERRQEDRPH